MPDALRLRVLIADDEAPARAKVRRFVERDSDVAVIFEARDGAAALSVIRDEAPDLVLLDIEMPVLTGLEVVAALSPETAPHVVFITAYDAHAVRAFELAAVDYVLKPFDAARFAVAMTRAKRALAASRRPDDLVRLLAVLQQTASAPPGDSSAQYPDRLPVEDGGRSVLVRCADIDWFEADDGEVRVHVAAQVRRIRFTLSELEQRLDPSRFARTGRSALVNLHRVHAFEAVGHGDYVLTMPGGGRVRLSRRYVSAVAARLGLP